MRTKALWPLFLVTFLYAFFMASIAYLHSSVLADSFGISEKLVGFLFSLGSLGGLILAFVLPRFFVRSYSVKQLLVATIINAAAAMVLLTVSSHPLVAVVATVLYLVANASFLYLGDIMLKHYSTPANTGRMRGLYMTMMAIAWVVAPMLSGHITEFFGSFVVSYAGAGIIAALACLIILLAYESFTPHEHHHGHNVLGDLRAFFQRSPLRRIFLTNAMLQTFYVIMVVYVPLHLSQTIGLSWSHMGLVFAIMLGAFVLFDYPFGYIADTRIGQKPLLVLGFMIIIGTTLGIAFMESTVWWHWAILMFSTRVGACMVEVMNESYFFKHIQEDEVSFIAYYRNARSVAYILVPLGASVMLTALGLELADLFIVLAGTAGLGLWWAWHLDKKS